MTRKEKLALRQHQSTRQLMGMQGIASHGITTSNSELVFFLIRPDNLSVLSSEGIRARVTALANLLRAEPAVELLVVDSREWSSWLSIPGSPSNETKNSIRRDWKRKRPLPFGNC